MKYILKLITALIFIPSFILAGIIAIIKTIIVVFFFFSWNTGDEWHEYFFKKIRYFMKWLNK